MWTKEEITPHLQHQFEQVIAWAESQPEAAITEGPDGKWTSGQQLRHILMSVEPLNTALRLPKIQLKMMFGKSNRETRSLDSVKTRYYERLAEGGKAPKEFIPKPVEPKDKAGLLADLAKNRDKLIKAIGKWKEEDLDAFVLPHPLMGKMPIREILFFTVFHTEHHYKALQEHYSVKDA
ncbi:MAG: DinB family protein [Bacteroidota bacterium]